MTRSGVALLAACTIAGNLLGEFLGWKLGVKANVGGVGLAMLLLIAARMWLSRRGWLAPGVLTGVGFWGTLYIPIVVAMAASQNVVAAVEAGPIVVATTILTVFLCFVGVALIGRFGGHSETMDEIEARESAAKSAQSLGREQP